MRFLPVFSTTGRSGMAERTWAAMANGKPPWRNGFANWNRCWARPVWRMSF
jgi:hypothetical protein